MKNQKELALVWKTSEDWVLTFETYKVKYALPNLTVLKDDLTILI
jgi:hypothetical protein